MYSPHAPQRQISELQDEDIEAVVGLAGSPAGIEPRTPQNPTPLMALPERDTVPFPLAVPVIGLGQPPKNRSQLTPFWGQAWSS